MREMKLDLTKPIQLIYKPEKRVIVSFPEGLQGKAQFGESVSHIEAAMREVGVSIPLENRAEFSELKEGDYAVYLDDPHFGLAFYNYHYLYNMDPDLFIWREMHG